MFFSNRNPVTGPLFKDSKSLKSFNKTALDNSVSFANL